MAGLGRVKIAPWKVYIKLKKKTLWPLFMDGVNCLKATATSRRQFTFYHSVPRNSWYSFYRPRKDEKLSQPWSHPVVLSTGPLDWESSALITWPLLHIFYWFHYKLLADIGLFFTLLFVTNFMLK